jgi:putative ABC transport system permease protein
LLVEGLLLAVVAGGAGLLLSELGVKAAVAAIPVEIPYWMSFAMDQRVLLFTLAASLASCLLFALAPAWHTVGKHVLESLKAGTRAGSEGRRRGKLRRVLVAGEVGLALLLMGGTGVMVRTFLNLQHANPGFSPEALWTFSVNLWAPEYRDEARRAQFIDQLLSGIRGLEGVAGVSAISNLPLGGSSWGSGFSIEGRPASAPEERPVGNTRVAAPGYFQTMKIPLLRGRDFDATDGPEGRRVVIIDETFARQYFPNTEPIGRRLKFGDADSPNPWLEIIGIVGEVQHYGFGRAVRPGFYLPHAQLSVSGMTIVFRADSESVQAGLMGAACAQVGRLDHRIVAASPRAMGDIVQRSFWGKRFFSQVFGVFALLALALAAVGVAAVVGHSVSQRTHEFGLRIALGAARGDVIRLVISQGLRPVLAGLGLGLAASWGMLRVLQSELYEVNATDPRLYLALALVMGLVALVAAYLPARRASAVEPMTALRCE